MADARVDREDTARADVALFLGELSGGGAEKVVVTLANGFAQRGHTVDLILARRRGPYLDEVDRGVRVVDLAAGSSLRALPALIDYLRKRRPRAILTTLHHTAIVALLAKVLARSDVRVFLREANTLSAMRPATWRGRMLLTAAGYAYRFADGVIAVSEGVAEDLRTRVPAAAERIVTIYNPIVGAELRRKSRQPVEHPWLSDPSLRVVLAAGRLTEQKDFGTLISAFGKLDDPQLRLVILGEGEERANLQKLVDSLGLSDCVDMPGFVSNPFSYMSRAALFVLSSRWEGMPGVLIQAMACGCSVVSTDCPSGPGEVLREGELGDLVPVGDEEALAEAMSRRLAGPHDPAPLIERASRFSEGASVDNYLQLLLPRQPIRQQNVAVRVNSG